MKHRNKILYIGNKLSGSGKTVTSIETLGEFLSKEGYTVITSSSKKNKILRILDMALTVIKNRNKVSSVLIDTYSTQNFYYAVVVAKLCRIFELPYIPILRGGNLPHRLESNKALSRKLFGGAKINVVPSQYLMESFKNKGYLNLIYIPNTIELKNYPYKLRSQAKPKLLWVRSFASLYNPLLALEVVEMLTKQGIECELCMVGPDKDGSLQRCKKVVQELNLPVTFTGILDKDAWISLSEDYDIFINTTNFDNMPVSVMEAMALGMPVISTNVGGLPYLIDSGTNGILVKPNNAHYFVDAIINLCENPLETQRLSQNGRSKMETFDWHEVKEQWIGLLGT